MNKYFDEEEINFIISSDKVSDYDRITLDIKTQDLVNYFISKKIDVFNIKEMIIEFPRLLTYSKELISDRYDNVEKIFNKKTNRLLISNPRIFSRSEEYFNDKIKYFIDFGLSKKEVIKTCLGFSTILTLGELNLDVSLGNLQEKINNKDMLVKLISSNARVLSYSNKTIDRKFNWFYEKGYTKEQTAFIVCKANTILTFEYKNDDEVTEETNQNSNIDEKYEFLYQDLKYSKEEIIIVTIRFPEYYTLSIDTIKERFNNLLKLGFSKDAIKRIFFNYPQIISFKEDTINKKYAYYLNVDMLDIFIKKPKYLMQSLILTDARYTYLINKGLKVNKDNYSKLFLSSKKFKKTYGIDNKELLKIYKENGGSYEQRTDKRNTEKYRTRIKESK